MTATGGAYSDAGGGSASRVAITLAIPTYNRREELARCLESCARFAPECVTLVVDDGGSDGTDQMLAERFPHVRCIRLPENRGPARARNIAIDAATTPYVAFFDSDVTLTPGWSRAVHDNLSPGVILAGRVEKPDGALEWGPRKIMPWGGSFPCAPDRANVSSSNNMVVPVALAQRIGGFAEELGIYFEDSFFCIQALRAGFHVRYVDAAVVTHHHHSQLSPERKRKQVRNRCYAMIASSRCPLGMALLQAAVAAAEALGAVGQGAPEMAGACIGGLVEGFMQHQADGQLACLSAPSPQRGLP
jgi:GT2 family glycosyltransferase